MKIQTVISEAYENMNLKEKSRGGNFVTFLTKLSSSSAEKVRSQQGQK